jgi:hypothetical protein
LPDKKPTTEGTEANGGHRSKRITVFSVRFRVLRGGAFVMHRQDIMRARFIRATSAWLFVLCMASGAAAQSLPGLPSEPIVVGNGTLTVGGDLSATVGPIDQGFFNYTDYEDSTLRMLRLDLTASLRAGSHVTLLGELRSQNVVAKQPEGWRVRAPKAYALFLRVRPWTKRRFDLQVGRIPPTFGAFPRRSYEADNPLIGYPLGYQYLTSLRADALPANADELLQMRGRGWLANYSVGNLTFAPGVPLATAFRWDTGVQAHAATDVMDFTGSITTGTLSNPLFTDDNSGRQLAGRIAVHPIAGLIVGASAAHGPFVSREAARAAVGGEHDGAFAQTAWGADAEYSRAYYLLRAETVFSQWTIPSVGLPAIGGPLRAVATYVEGRYKIRPGLYVAVRADHLGFSELTGSKGPATWDAPVSRVEAGGGYSIQRNLLLKVSTQFDRRDGGRTRNAHFVAGQLVFWF